MNLTSFSFLGNVGRIGWDLSVRPNSQWEITQGGPICFNTVDSDIPFWAVACQLTVLWFLLFAACLLKNQPDDFILW